MKQHPVKHSCGHVHFHNLRGTSAEQNQKAEDLQAGECPLCRNMGRVPASVWLEERYSALGAQVADKVAREHNEDIRRVQANMWQSEMLTYTKAMQMRQDVAIACEIAFNRAYDRRMRELQARQAAVWQSVRNEVAPHYSLIAWRSPLGLFYVEEWNRLPDGSLVRFANRANANPHSVAWRVTGCQSTGNLHSTEHEAKAEAEKLYQEMVDEACR